MMNETKKRVGSSLGTLFFAALFFALFLLPLQHSTAEASFLDFIRGFVTINPLELEVTAPPEVEVNRVFKITANVLNKGTLKVDSAEGEIFLPAGLSVIGQNTIKKAGVIVAERDKDISWSVRGTSLGNYVVSVSIRGKVDGDFVDVEGSTVLSIVDNGLPGQLGVWGRIILFLQKFTPS